MHGSLLIILHITSRWFSSTKTETLKTTQPVLVLCVHVCMPFLMSPTFGSDFSYCPPTSNKHQTSPILYVLKSTRTQKKIRFFFFCVRETPQKFWKQPNSTVQRIPRQRLKTLQTMRHTAVMHKLPYMHGEPQLILES